MQPSGSVTVADQRCGVCLSINLLVSNSPRLATRCRIVHMSHIVAAVDRRLRFCRSNDLLVNSCRGVKELEPSVANESVVLKGIALVHQPPGNKHCRSTSTSRRRQHGQIVIGNGGIGVDQAHGLRLSSLLEIKRHCIITNNEFSPSAFIQRIVISDYTLYIAGMLH
ncbi:hypothetical protein NL676_004489 [Syzygium grande]|nr:hypothetical protein NL676_004489 [Syzygium grande]